MTDKKRRSRGLGAVYQRSDGYWVGSVDLGWRDGKRRRKSVYGRTERDAQVKLAAVRRAAEDNLPMPSDRLTVGRFIEQWLVDDGQRVRPHTRLWYSNMLRGHVIPELGRRPLGKLAPDEVQALYIRKLDKLAPLSFGHIHRILHAALQDALFQGKVPRNVLDAVKPPRVPRKEVQALTVDEARRLLAAAAGDPMEALYVLALTSGLRQSELVGLKWADVDFERGKLRVQRGIRRLRGGDFIEAEPKSASSQRAVTLTPMALSALKRHRTAQAAQRLAAVVWDDQDLVFTNAVGRPMDAESQVRRGFRRLLERAGLSRVKFHALRHSAASLLLVQRIHPRVVAEMLGHGSVKITLSIYSHLIADMQQDAAAAVQSLLTGTEN